MIRMILVSALLTIAAVAWAQQQPRFSDEQEEVINILLQKNPELETELRERLGTTSGPVDLSRDFWSQLKTAAEKDQVRMQELQLEFAEELNWLLTTKPDDPPPPDCEFQPDHPDCLPVTNPDEG